MDKTRPGWVWIGGFYLSFMAGMINSVGFLGVNHEALSHLTGATSQAAIAFYQLRWNTVIHLTSIILSFICGAALSGYLIQKSNLRIGRPYGKALLIEAFLLFTAIPLLNLDSSYGEYLASAACGMQNGLASSFSGMIIRTAHLSGVFTDIGLLLGHVLRGAEVELARLKILLAIIAGFTCGGITGAAMFPDFHYNTLAVPAVLALAAAAIYSIVKSANT